MRLRIIFGHLLTGVLLLLATSLVQAQPSLEWTRTFPSVGAPNVILPNDIITDAVGNVYTTGVFYNTRDFDPGPGTCNLTSTGGSNIFISKLNASGDFVWAARIGGVAGNSSVGIAVDNSGNVYTAGSYVNASTDFDPGPGVANLPGNGGYVCKLDASGQFVWVRRIGPAGPGGISVDTFGDIITTGLFSGTGDFDPSAGVVNLTSAGSFDIFVSKITASGDLVWAKRMGGTSSDDADAITSDILGNIYTTGTFQGTADFDPDAGTVNLTSAGLADVFISKLSSAGALVWVKRIGGTGFDGSQSIALDGSGNVLTTGSFANTVDFDPGATVFNLTSSGGSDIYISKLDPAGNFTWAKAIGGSSFSTDIVSDASDNVLMTGYYSSVVDFDPGVGVFDVTPFMSPEAFVSKLDANGNFGWVVMPRGLLAGYESEGSTLTLDPSGNVLASGWFEGPVDFDPGVCDDVLTATSDDIYIWKLNPVLPNSAFCNPVITGFTPAGGPVGTTVTISGSRFSGVAANNIVYFGATRATVTQATANQLAVIVPTGATYQPLSVTVNGLTASSAAPFLVTFPDGGTIDACSFSPLTGFGAFDFGYGIATGDLDLDGKVDILISKSDVAGVQVFRNTSATGILNAATFAPPFTLAVGTTPAHVTVADVDSDGKLDLLATGFDDNIVSIFRNIATPGSLSAASFESRVDLSTVTRPLDVEAADLDGDGKTDIVVATEGRVSFWRNIGASGSLSTASFEARQDILINSWSLAVSDLDVDGKPDLILGPALSSVAHVLRNISTPGTLVPGSFAAGVNFTVGAWPDYIITGDLDNDQRPEILTSSWPSGSFSILKNTSSPGTIDATSFAPHVQFSGLTEPRGTAITDFDGDGKPDIAIGLQIAGRVNVYKNISTAGIITPASFAPYVDFVAGGNMRLLKAADFDGDGKPDLAATNWSGSPLSVIRNTVSPNPTVTGFTPASGPKGTVVTISGTFFSTIVTENTVQFNGVTAPIVSATSTTLTVVVPATATSGPVTVTKTCKPTATGPGTFTVTPFAFDPCRTSIDLNGAGDYVRVTSNATLEPSTLTLEALINFSSAPSFDVILAKPDGSAFGNSFAIWWQGGQLQAGVRLGGSIGAPWTPVIGQWYHVALTYNSVTQVERLYLDGQQIASGSVIAPFYAPDDLLIGADVNFAVVDGFFHGKLDEVRMWNTERSEADILINMNASLGGSEPGLVAYYKMNQSGVGAGVQVSNNATATGSVNDGTTFGSAATPVFDSPCSCVPIAQRDALIALYNATDGANWTDNTGWLSADEGTWVGVTLTGCDVTDISLPGNNLIGSLPAEIGDLPMLEGLDLGANQLSGSIPPEIGNLTNLIGLNLAINQLDSFLPPELGNLTNLEALNLAFNMLNGTPPIELENLTSLVDAALNNNQFSGQPPLIGGNSMSMSNLQLQFNSFNSLPDFNAYYSISSINVANNRLTFDDLEPFMGLSNFFYDPQAFVPPGGIVAFIPGGTLNIPFSTGGTANSYQWYKDNVAIPGATSPSYSLPGATAAAVGFYHVRITSAVVPFLELRSETYTVITDPCASTTPTSGDLDTGFAPLIDVPSTFNQVEVQSTGKIITESGGTMINSVSRQGLLRFLPDGTLDNTFASNINTSPFLVQPNDQILASYYGSGYAYLKRMDADGNEDASFTANVPQYYSGYVSAVALQSDNKILVAGNEYMSQPFIQRLNPDGTADGYLPDATGLDVSVIRIQTNGYILVGGQFIGGIARLDPTGVLDPSFLADIDDFVSDIAIQSDGKILVGGQFRFVNDIPKRALVRLLPDGSIDNSFSALGITNLTESGFNIRKIALQTDGKIVLAGEFESINGADRKNLVRLNSDGTVDCLFDAGVSTDLPIVGLALPSDSQILISGSFGDYDGTQRYGLARVNSGSIASCVPAIQRDALIALYNSTNGASWSNRTNWLNADESSWFGVIVQGCNVTEINLDNNQLAGPLPTELGDLTALKILRLSNNTLTGAIPAAIGNLTALNSLQLFNNQLSGSLPAGLFGLTSLQLLDLSNNQFTGNLSTSVGNLTGLTYLSLSINQLTGSIPTEIGNLVNLEYLRLALNQFSGTLPPTVGNLLLLKEFSVSTNLLTGTVPATLANLTNLTVLGLSFNNFSGDLPPGIGSLNALQQVSVRSNQFTSLPAFTSTAITELRTENNRFHFGHLEPNAGKTGFTYSPQSNLAGGSGNACEGTTLTLAFSTPGTANQYQWYKDGVLITGATTANFVKNNAALTDAGSYVVHVTNTVVPGLTLQSDPFTVTIDAAPSAPGATGGLSCTASSFILTATGGSPGEYRWYSVPAGGTDLGTGNDTFVTPVIATTTVYYAALYNGTCESLRTPVTATIDVVAKPSIATSGCTASGATLTGPVGFTSYAWSNGATGQAINVTAAGTYTLVVTSSGGCLSPVSDPVTFTAAFCNQPPVLQPTTVTTTVQGTATINLTSLTSDLDNNVDLTTLQIITQPASGAMATINASFELVVDYTDVDFIGTDQITLQVCDVAGACVQEIITIEVAGDITVFNALSPNGDGLNDVFYIQYIDALPETQENKVTIFNRWGTVVFETTNYDNSNNVFRGLSNSGAELPSGTYYYTLEFSSGAEKRTGFISLRR